MDQLKLFDHHMFQPQFSKYQELLSSQQSPTELCWIKFCILAKEKTSFFAIPPSAEEHILRDKT